MAHKRGVHSRSSSQKNAKRVLSRTPFVAGACELDLLLFLRRHPHIMLNNQQLARLIGYGAKQVERAINRFMAAGVLEHLQAGHLAGYRHILALRLRQLERLEELLKVASTQRGRREVLEVLNKRMQTRGILKGQAICEGGR